MEELRDGDGLDVEWNAYRMEEGEVVMFTALEEQ